MRNVFLLVLTLALVLLAAALAPVILQDPGLVQIRFRGWTLEMNVLVLTGVVLSVWLILYLAIRIWRLPGETARRMREQRAMKQLEKGLLALTEGDWIRAERALQKSTPAQGQATARYLAAAQAADGQEAPERTEWYLEQADSGGAGTASWLSSPGPACSPRTAVLRKLYPCLKTCVAAASVIPRCWSCYPAATAPWGDGSRCRKSCRSCRKPG